MKLALILRKIIKIGHLKKIPEETYKTVYFYYLRKVKSILKIIFIY